MLSIGEFAHLGQVSPRTIRHYGDVGILEPVYVDPSTGYRSYEVGQLSVLRRILAYVKLGVGLEQVRELLAVDGELSVEQLRGMLRLRESEIAASISEQRGSPARSRATSMHSSGERSCQRSRSW